MFYFCCFFQSGYGSVKLFRHLPSACFFQTTINFPVDWARTQSNLGNAYLELPTDDQEANKAKAIVCYKAAARGYSLAGLTEKAEEALQLAAKLEAE